MLTLQFIPYHDIEPLSSEARVKKLLTVVKENKVVVMEGRLKPSEESTLIQRTMEEVSKDFKGIELCTLYPQTKKAKQLLELLRQLMFKMIMGNRTGITIIGPATIIKEIRRDPNKIELMTSEATRRRRGR